MSRITKNITVNFFSVEADDDFFRGFVSSFLASTDESSSTRIFNLRSKSHLIKAKKPDDSSLGSEFYLTVVRERNTWQTRATRNGKLTGINSNQGIIGDPYFFVLVPKEKLLLGFTSGPSGSLKSVSKVMLEQFKSDRKSNVRLSFVPKEKDYASLSQLPASGEMYFKIDTSSLADDLDEAPQIIRDIGSSPFFEQGIQLIFNWQFEESEDSRISRQEVIDVVNFFANNDGCQTLRIRGKDSSGQRIKLDFGDAFLNYKTQRSMRQSFFEEQEAHEILQDALSSYKRNAKSKVE